MLSVRIKITTFKHFSNVLGNFILHVEYKGMLLKFNSKSFGPMKKKIQSWF